MTGFLMFPWSFYSTVCQLLSHYTFGQHRTVDALWSRFGKYVSIIMSCSNIRLSRIRTKLSELQVGCLSSRICTGMNCWMLTTSWNFPKGSTASRVCFNVQRPSCSVLACFDNLNSWALALSCEHMKQFTLLPEGCSLCRQSDVHATLYRRHEVSHRPKPWTGEPYLYGKGNSLA